MPSQGGCRNVNTTVVREHPEWLLQSRQDDGPVVLGGSNGGESCLMDYTVHGALEWLRQQVRLFVDEWHVRWIKLDGPNYSLYRRGRLADRTRTVSEMLLDTFRLIRAEAGEEVLVQGEGMMGLALGHVDVHRVQSDNHPMWYRMHSARAPYAPRVYGKELVMAFLHGRWWCNHRENVVLWDWPSPLCHARLADEEAVEQLFTEAELRTQLVAAAMAPGGLLLTDPMKELRRVPDRFGLISRLLPVYPRAAQMVATFPDQAYLGVRRLAIETPLEVYTVLGLINWSDETRDFELEADAVLPQGHEETEESMLVAIIGGTRHVGPSIVEGLVAAGHQVQVYTRGQRPAQLPDEVERVTVDRKIPGQVEEALRRHQPDAVIDMIGYQVADVKEVHAALPGLRHYVFCSTTGVYGRIGRTTPTESGPLAPDSPYTFGKVDCEQFLLDRNRQDGWPVTILRLAHPYGPGDHLLYTSGREALFLDRMRHGRPILIPGDGQSRIHPVYMEDAGRAFVHVLDSPGCMGQVYNLSGEQILTLDEYFASISRVLGIPLAARRLPHTFFRDRAELWADWPRKFDFGYNWVRYESGFDVSALGDTGFQCLTDHDVGVAKTLEWLEAREMIPPSSDRDEEDRILDDPA